MDNHLACVNCLRWNSTGEMLATGSDDKLIMIWKKSNKPSGALGSGGMKQNIENWRCVHTLRGHSGDVLDLAWSPQDRWLATSSVDNTIIVWDALVFPNIISILKGHTGLVKGVTWDPVGKFLASQSDDKTVRLWKTQDWSCQTIISDPFEECGGTTHVLRLSWSPDGQYLVSAHAMNNGAPTAQIIERDGWKTDKDFVGHRKAVTSVRFNSAILTQGAPGSKQQRYCCLAMGSRDRSLSLWSTNLQRPMTVFNDLFQDSILDLSWSANGCILMACSSDGSVACIEFDKEELGTPLNNQEKHQLYQRIYGKDISLDFGKANKDVIIENAELLMDTKEHSSSVQIQKTNPPVSVPPKATTPTVPTVQESPKRIFKQIESRTVDGKRRITPMFIPLNEEQPVEIKQDKSCTISATATTSSKPTFPLTLATTSFNNSGSSNDSFPSTNTGKLDARIKKVTPPCKVINVDEKHNTLNKPEEANKVETRMAIQRPESGNAKPLKGPMTKAVGNLRVQVVNESTTTPLGKLSKIICSMLATGGNKKLWEAHLESPIVAWSCCSRFILTCSIDCTVRFFESNQGVLLLPVIALSSPVVLCAISSNLSVAGILTKTCELRVWNIEQKRVNFSLNCADVFAKSTATNLFLNEQGIPFITLADGSSYSYSRDLEAWLKLSSSDIMSRTMLAKHISSNFVRNMKSCPLTTVQSFGKGFNKMNFDMVTDSWPHTMELLFLENQIKLCESLNSIDEIKYWYGALGTKLASHGGEQHIRKLLDELLNNLMVGDESDGKNNDKKIYLEILLNKLKEEPRWQRLYMEYYDQISC